MSRFLIEVPHEAGQVACARAIHLLLTTGSHFVTHAEWGCKDGVHSAWIIVEVGSKEEALGIVPPAYRPGARVVGLNRFSLADIESILSRHAISGGPKDA